MIIIRQYILQEDKQNHRMEEEEISQAFFEAAIANMSRQIFEKQLAATKIEMDIVRKLEGKSEIVSAHIHIIRNCRRSVESVSFLLRDIRSFFQNLKIVDLFEICETIFRVLIYNIKKLSECYLRRFQFSPNSMDEDEQKQLKLSNKDVQQSPVQSPIANLSKADKIRKMEHLDFQITGLEVQEAALQKEMLILMKDLDNSKPKISRINETSHQLIYHQVERGFVQVSRKAEALFNTFLRGMTYGKMKTMYMEPQRFQEQILLKLQQKFNKISQQKIQKMKEAIKSTLVQKLQKQKQKVVTIFEENFEMAQTAAADYISKKTGNYLTFKSNQNQIDGVVDEEAERINRSTNVDTELFLKEKEIQNLKRINKMMEAEMAEMRNVMKSQQNERVKLLAQSKEIQVLFKKRTCEYQAVLTDLKFLTQRTNKQIADLTGAKAELQQKLKKLNKKSCSMLFDPEVEEKQTQTEAQTTLKDDSALNTRIKLMRKTSTNDVNLKRKNTLAQNKLKQYIEEICHLLIEKSEELDGKNQESEEIALLLKQGKFQLLISKIKERLDMFYEEVFPLQIPEENNIEGNGNGNGNVNGNGNGHGNRISLCKVITKKRGNSQSIRNSIFGQFYSRNCCEKGVQTQIESIKGIEIKDNKKEPKKLKRFTQENTESNEMDIRLSLNQPKQKQTKKQNTPRQTKEIKKPDVQRLSKIGMTKNNDRASHTLKSVDRISGTNTPRNLKQSQKGQIQSMIDRFNQQNLINAQNQQNRFSEGDYEPEAMNDKKTNKLRQICNVMFQQINIGAKMTHENKFVRQMMQKVQNQRGKYTSPISHLIREEDKVKESQEDQDSSSVDGKEDKQEIIIKKESQLHSKIF